MSSHITYWLTKIEFCIIIYLQIYRVEGVTIMGSAVNEFFNNKLQAAREKQMQQEKENEAQKQKWLELVAENERLIIAAENNINAAMSESKGFKKHFLSQFSNDYEIKAIKSNGYEVPSYLSQEALCNAKGAKMALLAFYYSELHLHLSYTRESTLIAIFGVLADNKIMLGVRLRPDFFYCIDHPLRGKYGSIDECSTGIASSRVAEILSSIKYWNFSPTINYDIDRKVLDVLKILAESPIKAAEEILQIYPI